jgi:nitroreductase
VLVVVGVDISPLPPQFAAPSTFPAVQNLLLAAAAYGYGSALTTFTALLTDELRAAVGFPAGIEPVAVVPIGRPARRLGPSRREPFETKTHRDRYGRAWARSGTVVHGAG